MNRDPSTLTGHEPFDSSVALTRNEGGAPLGSDQQQAEGSSPKQADAAPVNARPQGRSQRRRRQLREVPDPSDPGGNLDSRRRY